MENIELMDNMMIVITLLIMVLVIYIIILLFKMYFNTQKNKVDKINSLTNSETINECLELFGRPHTIANGYFKTFDYTFHIGFFRKVNLYITFDHEWKVTNYFSIHRTSLF